MAKRLKTRPIPLHLVVEAADHANFDAAPFGMLTAFAYAYWRNPFDTGAIGSNRLAFLCRCGLAQLRPYERAIRAEIPALSANLFAAREAIENQASGLVALLDKVNATRRARVAEGKRAKVSAPGRMAPLKHWGARRAAVEARAAGAIGFTD